MVLFDSKGPCIFVQDRVGLNKAIFRLYKFRTMKIGSEHGNKYTEENDSRITRIGKFLRRSRLDELPQLLNVLKGEMSLIGPRSEWTKCVSVYENLIPFYHLRHLIRPGITGWAQVLYNYGSSVEDAQEKLQYDIYYIKNHSLFLDIAIIFKTIRIICLGKGR